MAASRPPIQAPEWLPSGFPPRSFPPGAQLPPPPRPPGPGRGTRGRRGWWLATAAALLALLLLAGALVLANRDDDEGPDLTAGTSTSAQEETSVPTFETTTTVVPVLPSIDPVSPPTGGSTPSAPPSAGSGVLEPSVGTLELPRADATAGASRGQLTLRNTGARGLTYTTQSSSPGLSATPAQGTIGPGDSVALTVTLDGARIQGEGRFAGTLSFGGAADTKTVEVLSVVGRPPEIRDDAGASCGATSAPCSRQIKVSSPPPASPCTSPWFYSVTIIDQSRIQSARVLARRNSANADLALRRTGTGNIFQSAPSGPLPAGTVLRFAVEAVDEHGFGRRLAEETISC